MLLHFAASFSIDTRKETWNITQTFIRIKKKRSALLHYLLKREFLKSVGYLVQAIELCGLQRFGSVLVHESDVASLSIFL